MKNILITGASSGFGKLSAQRLSLEGHRVFATVRNQRTANTEAVKALRQWSEVNQTAIEIIELDVTRDDSVERAVTSIADQTAGQIDVLINNAGLAATGVNEAFTARDASAIFDVNVFGSHRLIKAVLPYMRRQSEGLIVQISSVLAKNPLPFTGLYAASKAAIDALVQTYRYELRPLGIDVVIVQPGPFPTDILSKSLPPGDPTVFSEYGITATLLGAFQQAFGRMLQPGVAANPDDVAQTLAELVTMPKGTRPLWKVIDQFGGETAIGQINDTSLKVSTNFLNQLGLGVLLQ